MSSVSGATRKKVQRKFKIRGFTLKVDALEEVLSFLSRFQDAENEALDLLLDEIDNESLKSSILDKDAVHRVVSLLLEAEAAVEPSGGDSSTDRSGLRVIDAFIIPKFCYDPIKKVFYEHTGRMPIHGDAGAKSALYRDRFQLLLQRISRDPHFSRPVFDAEMIDSRSCEITSIQSLIGCTGRRWIMGVISQLEDGHFFLEDLTAAVPVNLSNAISFPLFTFLLIVNTCGFPPLEDRDASLAVIMGLDFFGGGSLSSEENLRLSVLEKKAVNDMFVILSDVCLDNEEKTMAKLAAVMDGYENVEVVPSLFVLMGNFCSRPCNLAFSSFSSLRLQFGKLGEIIGAHPRLKEHSRFLFLPGPDDIGPSKVLPRIKFYTQEIVFFRQDLLYRMRRSSLIPPSKEETSDPFEHLVATITHQSHLCPLPLTVQPIIWNYDHCLRLHPTPHTIVLGDTSEQKAFKYTGITCFNPGSFSSDSTFVAYRPCTQEVELSSL
ncbi:DNA polymerase epsilon subunit B [Cinnamomum micranthum f. kanehirae]|uniref:DNA polymerase epsilon subunit n=1 Tax=Cinnamomum micranthum f. kanehirae TaxID=337451 RepID=A0A443PYU8_9MAGN|nr:DNA polymerase epsilon subunit B [Cinnamomum micranthum f. kanehirae]